MHWRCRIVSLDLAGNCLLCNLTSPTCLQWATQKTIPLQSITSVKPVTSIAASAATSTKRLEILYNKYDLIYISPLEEDAFLAEVQSRCPGATVQSR
ncbi:PH domain-containing protein [uncultured Brevibacillus sp.]|uniref:PH domain-containing protein n=1 Tax=uncultured Brevibacillus sp. TaxID=169970 RepID=UPI00338F5DDB